MSPGFRRWLSGGGLGMALAPGGAKSKGASGEREAAALLALWAAEVGFKVDPSRNLEQVRGGGYDLNGVPGLGIEVKRVEAPNLTGWWRQALRQADADGTTPFLMHRQNRRPWRFRVRSHVAIYGSCEAGAVAVDMDLDIAQAKVWFQYYVWLHRDQLEEIEG